MTKRHCAAKDRYHTHIYICTHSGFLFNQHVVHSYRGLGLVTTALLY